MTGYVPLSQRLANDNATTSTTNRGTGYVPLSQRLGSTENKTIQEQEEEKRKKLEEEIKKQNEIPVNEEPITIEEVNDEGFLKKASRDISGSIKSGELFKAIGVGAENAINQTADMLSSIGSNTVPSVIAPATTDPLNPLPNPKALRVKRKPVPN